MSKRRKVTKNFEQEPRKSYIYLAVANFWIVSRIYIMHGTYSNADLCPGTGIAPGHERLVSRVNPQLVDAILEAISLTFRYVIRLMNDKVGSTQRKGGEPICGISKGTVWHELHEAERYDQG